VAANSIPASTIVNITPGVLAAGGTGLDMRGLVLTSNPRAPIGSILNFATAKDVSAYFGPSSDETRAATIYFNGFINSTIKPGSMLFAPYATGKTSAYLRGARLGLSLTALQALDGTLIITIDGTALTSAEIKLATATSFSNAATIIQAAFTSPGFTVTYDAIADAFVFTSVTTGAASTVDFASGTLAAGLKLDQTSGAILSQGADAFTPGPAMDAIVAATQDFVAFTTLFASSDDEFEQFGVWNGGQNNRYLHVGWTSNSAATQFGDTTSPIALLRAASVSGTAGIWAPTFDKAIFALGYIASIDFTRTNGRTVAAFRSGDGLTADVTNATIAQNLKTNGYNFYGAWATANQQFTWFYNGQVTGDFAWVDSYLDQIWMNNAFQLSFMVALGTLGQIPYNADGYATLETVIQSDIDNAVSFGAIRAGVTLSSTQLAAVIGLVGQDISDVLFSRGWYLQFVDPGATVRAARGSPIGTFVYTDGQSVQQINLSSLMVQ
jgi:hypothetical protein